MRTLLTFGLAGAIAFGPPLSLAPAQYSAQYMQERAYCVPRYIELHTADRCPYCAAAKQFFARYGIFYNEVFYGPLWNAPPGGVPQILFDTSRIVGFDEAEMRRAFCVR